MSTKTYRNEMTSWDKKFREGKGKIEEYSVCLYWYLLNRSDYPEKIAKNFHDFFHRRSLDSSSNVKKYLSGGPKPPKPPESMLKKNLILECKDIKKDKKRSGRPPKYYKVNAAFLCLPYYDELGTRSEFFEDLIDRYYTPPEVFSEPKKDYTIEVGKEINWLDEGKRLREGPKTEKEALLSIFNEDSFVSSPSISSVNELLEFVQKISREPKEFIDQLNHLKKLNYISLWMLIQKMFYELYLYIKINERLKEYEDDKKIIKMAKKYLEKTAILDLKKINDLPKEEIPQDLNKKIKELYNYLSFLIKVYSCYESGTLMTDPLFGTFFGQELP